MRTPRPLIAAVAAAALLAACGGGDSPETLIASAREYIAKKDHPAAIIQLKNALQKDVNSAEARFLLGQSLLANGDPVGAAVELRKARDLKHPDVQVVPLLASAMLQQGLFKAVNDEFEALELDDPKAQADLKVALASAYAVRGLSEPTEQAVQAALQAQPDHAGARVFQARLLAGKRDFDGAMKTIDEVIAQFPQDDAAWKIKGDLLQFTRQDAEGALAAFRKAVELNPRNLEAHAGALAMLFASNDPEKVEPQLEALKKVYPRHPQTRYFEAQLAFVQRDFAKAKELITPLAQSGGNNVRVLQLAGAIELHFGPVSAIIERDDHIPPLAELVADVEDAAAAGGEPAQRLREEGGAERAQDGDPPLFRKIILVGIDQDARHGLPVGVGPEDDMRVHRYRILGEILGPAPDRPVQLPCEKAGDRRIFGRLRRDQAPDPPMVRFADIDRRQDLGLFRRADRPELRGSRPAGRVRRPNLERAGSTEHR